MYVWFAAYQKKKKVCMICWPIKILLIKVPLSYLTFYPLLAQHPTNFIGRDKIIGIMKTIRIWKWVRGEKCLIKYCCKLTNSLIWYKESNRVKDPESTKGQLSPKERMSELVTDGRIMMWNINELRQLTKQKKHFDRRIREWGIGITDITSS